MTQSSVGRSSGKFTGVSSTCGRFTSDRFTSGRFTSGRSTSGGPTSDMVALRMSPLNSRQSKGAIVCNCLYLFI